MFTRDNYITIPGWAITDLKLSGSELVAFSLVYGFSQDSESEFRGSLAYMAGALNLTKPNAKAVLDRLVEKEMLVKRDEVINGVKFCRYSINRGIIETITPLLKQERGVIETIPNNTNDNDSTLLSLRSKSVNRTTEKLCLFCNSKFHDLQTFLAEFTGPEFAGIDIAFYYYAINDWSSAGQKKKHDWIATARNWIRTDMQRGNVRRTSSGADMLRQYIEDRKQWEI